MSNEHMLDIIAGAAACDIEPEDFIRLTHLVKLAGNVDTLEAAWDSYGGVGSNCNCRWEAIDGHDPNNSQCTKNKKDDRI